LTGHRLRQVHRVAPGRRQLGYVYADSGAVYRGITWQILRDGLSRRKRSVLRRLRDIRLDFENRDNVVRMKVNGADPGLEIRSEKVLKA